MLRIFIKRLVVEAMNTNHSNLRNSYRLEFFKNFKLYNSNKFIATGNFTENNLKEYETNYNKLLITNFNEKKSYMILMMKLELNKTNVKFEKGYSIKDINENTYLKNPATSSEGNLYYAIVRENKIATIMWVRNDFKKQKIELANVDFVIDDFQNWKNQ